MVDSLDFPCSLYLTLSEGLPCLMDCLDDSLNPVPVNYGVVKYSEAFVFCSSPSFFLSVFKGKVHAAIIIFKMAWRFKASKYKNAAPIVPKPEACIRDISVGSYQTYGNNIAASAAFMAFNVDHNGINLYVFVF